MKTVRWICFIPISSLLAVVVALLWGQIVPFSHFGTRGVLELLGAAPLFIGRVIGVFTFILLGAFIAPRRTNALIVTLAILGGIFGWPFGGKYEIEPVGPTLYLIEGAGTLVGVTLGALSAFRLVRAGEQTDNRASDINQ